LHFGRSTFRVSQTVAFYAALHLVDRLAARANYHPANHTERNFFVTRQHRAIGNASLWHGQPIRLIDQRLVQIETYVNNVFNPPPPPPAQGGTGNG
jgi:hypothetical protein